MALSQMRSFLHPYRILFRAAGGADPGIPGIVLAGSVHSQPRINVFGYRRVVGKFHCDVAPAAGFPRVRVGMTPLAFSDTYVITQDFTQAGFVFPFDILLNGDWVSVEWTTGGAAGAFLRILACALPE